MVKAAKFMVLVAGLAGLIAFFLPFLKAESQGKSASISAFQAVKGIDTALEKTDAATAGAAATPEAKSATAEIADVVNKVKAFLYAMYAPALLLFLFGLIGVLKKKFGRGFGVLSLLMGLVALGFWALLFMAAGEANKDSTGGDVKVALGLGVHLLLVTGILGFLGGITNTVKPDRGFM
jgi:hypothetical protein